MYIGTPTIWNISLGTSRARGIPYRIPQFSTINEALADPILFPLIPSDPNRGMQITDDYDYTTDSELVKLTLFCIGNRGLTPVIGNGNLPPSNLPKPHASTDAALYGQVPFVIKPVTNDLTGTDRARFRLRRTLEIDGELYAAYYGRVLPVVTAEVERVVEVTLPGQATQTSVFTPTVNNLRLTDPDVSGNNTYTAVRANYRDALTFTAQDVLWFEEAAELLFGSASYARFSEVAICTGVDKLINARYPDAGGAVTPLNSSYYESVGVQVYTFNSTEIVAYGSQGFVLDVDSGASELLFARVE
jgi:hypothetical protein